MKLSGKLLFRKEYDGTGILFDPENGSTFSLNKTTTVICEQLAKDAEKKDILSALAVCTTGLPDCAEVDLDRFLDALREKKYLAE